MDSDKQMIVKSKLNFFQRIKKASLIKKINKENYKKAPDYLKKDEEVIRALLFKNPNDIEIFDIEKRVDIVSRIEDVFRILPFDKKIEIISEEPNFILQLESNQRLSYVLSANKLEYIKILPENEQLKLLTEQFEYDDIKYNLSYKPKSFPNNYFSKLENFSAPVLEQAIKKLLDENPNNRESIISQLEISRLPIDFQLKLASYDDLLIKKMSFEAAEEYVGNNPMFLEKLEKKVLIELIKKQPKFFKVLNNNLQSSLLKSDMELQTLISDEERIKKGHEIYNKKTIEDPEAIKRSLIDAQGIRNGNITDFVRKPDVLIDIGRFDPIALSTRGIINQMTAFAKMRHVMDLYKNGITDSALRNELDNLNQRIIQMDVEKMDSISTNLPKIFLNEKVMERVKPELLVDFVRNPSMDIVQDIIAITYGEQTREIFKDRPNITLDQIQTLDIFDPLITERYGVGVVHNLLSYDTYATNILGELVRKSDKFEKFGQFESLFNKEENHILDFNNKLIAYKKIEGLLMNIDLESLNDMQKENLLLVVNDMNMSLSENETSVIPLENIDDLENYAQKRNEIYLDYLEKTNDVSEIKDAISRRFFGIEYKSGNDDYYRHTTLSMKAMIRYYNLETFISDERTQESPLFNQEELDMLELMNIINKVDDPNVLKQLYKELSESKDILTPVDFNEVKSKIPQQYSKELVDSLLTVENAKERAEKGEQGILYEVTEDGIDVIKLSGADFRLLIHTMGMKNSGLQIPMGKTNDELWKTFEEGCSTISGCVIEPEMLHSCAIAGNVNLGFAKVNPKQVVGMSHYDALVSHLKGRIDPEFGHAKVSFNYPDELVRKTAAQITGQEPKDTTHLYNEVAMYRKNVDSSQISNGEFGGRIMPDYIVVYGKASGNHKELAKSFLKDGKPIPIIEIDVKAYGDRTYQRGMRKEDHTTEREEGKVVKKVKEVINNEIE